NAPSGAAASSTSVVLIADTANRRIRRADYPSCLDRDGDGFGSIVSTVCVGGTQLDCDDLNPARFPGNPEICDGIDNDCANGVPADEVDADHDGVRVCEGDCYDFDGGSIAPPVAITGLDVDPTYLDASGEVRFIWDGQEATAGSGVIYDIFSGSAGSLRD